MLAQEDDIWTVSLMGRDGERPPLELEEFRAWARSLVTPALAEQMERVVPIDGGARFRFPANRRRRYEHLTRFPRGLVVTGDALCAFDPVYAQGMSVAALEAEALDRCLAEGVLGLARRFHAAAATTIETPWTIAVGPANASSRKRDRLLQQYLARLIGTAAHDPVLARAFLRVNHLVDRPQDLVRPSLALRVWRGSRSRVPERAVNGVRHSGSRVDAVEASHAGTPM